MVETGFDGGREGLWEGSPVGWEGSSQGSRVDLWLFYPQFSDDSHLLGENKVNRNPLKSKGITRNTLNNNPFFAKNYSCAAR